MHYKNQYNLVRKYQSYQYVYFLNLFTNGIKNQNDKFQRLSNKNFTFEGLLKELQCMSQYF